jgi:ribose transport system substrate-binding protein
MTRAANWIGLFLATVAIVGGCNKSDSSSSGGAPTTQAAAGGGGGERIAVIPKGTTHAYWKTVHAGAEAAAKDLNVDITWHQGRRDRLGREGRCR